MLGQHRKVKVASSHDHHRYLHTSIPRQAMQPTVPKGCLAHTAELPDMNHACCLQFNAVTRHSCCAQWCAAMQVAARRAEAVKWQQMQQAHSVLQNQQQQLVAEIQEWKARYRDEAAYSSELQAAANRLQSELTAAQLESQVWGL